MSLFKNNQFKKEALFTYLCGHWLNGFISRYLDSKFGPFLIQFIGSLFAQPKHHSCEELIGKTVLCIFFAPHSIKSKNKWVYMMFSFFNNEKIKWKIPTSVRWVSIWINVRAFSRKRISSPDGTL